MYLPHRVQQSPLIEMRTKIKQQGFTLLEIMLVVSIIVIILGVAISKLGNTTAIAKPCVFKQTSRRSRHSCN